MQIFYCFWCNCTWNRFLHSIFTLFILVYRNTTDFCILILVLQFCWTHLWVLIVLFCELLKIVYIRDTLSVKGDTFTSLITIGMPFYFLFLLNCPGYPPPTLWDNIKWKYPERTSLFVLGIRGEASFFTIKYDSCGFSLYYVLY